MRLTLRVKENNYIDIDIDFNNRYLVFLSGVPDTELEDLMQLADDFNFKILFPITDEQITPDKDNPIINEVSVIEALQMLLALSTIVVTEY